MKNLVIAIISLILSIIFVFPTLILVLGFVAAVYAKFISGIFCFVFAYNIAKYVESKYKKFLEIKKEPGEEFYEDDRIRYTIIDDTITFTFKAIKGEDGRQLSRLKFMRENFFKD